MIIQLLGKKHADTVLISKTATTNDVYRASDFDADGFDVFTVAVPNGTETLTATENNTYTPTSPNIGFSSVTVDVTPTIDPLSVTPSTSAQTFTPSGGTDGYGPVSVSAVDSGIDANIQAGNIKSGVSILGVAGSVTELQGEERTVSITARAGNTFTPSSGKNGITSVTAVPNLQTSSVTATTYPWTLVPNTGYCGFSEINVQAVDSSIDANIIASNIKSGVTILGVTGNVVSEKYNTTVNSFLGNIDNSGVLQRPSEVANLVFTGVEDLYGTTTTNGALYFAFYKKKNIGTVSFPDLEDAGGFYCMSNAFQQSSITSVSFPKLKNISGGVAMYQCFYNSSVSSISFPLLETIGEQGMYQAFYGCSNLTTAQFPSLTTLYGRGAMIDCFYGCTSLTTVILSALKTISDTGGLHTTFSGCTSLTTMTFDALDTIPASQALIECFEGCTSLRNIYFPALKSTSFGSNTDQFNYMLYNVTGCTVHFPSNLQSVISSWPDVMNGFGGTNTTVSFDLPATE